MWRLIFQIVPVAAWVVAFVVVVRPLALSRRGAFAASALFAVALGKFAFFATVGGDAFTPNLPALVIWSYGWIYAAAMMLIAAAFPFSVFCYLLGLLKIRVPVLVTRGAAPLRRSGGTGARPCRTGGEATASGEAGFRTRTSSWHDGRRACRERPCPVRLGTWPCSNEPP